MKCPDTRHPGESHAQYWIEVWAVCVLLVAVLAYGLTVGS